MKEQISAEIKELGAFVDEQVKAVEEVEGDFADLAAAMPKDLSAADMLAASHAIEAKIKAAKRNIANLQEKVKALDDDLDPDLEAWFQGASEIVVNNTSSLQDKLDRVLSWIEDGREELVKTDKRKREQEEQTQNKQMTKNNAMEVKVVFRDPRSPYKRQGSQIPEVSQVVLGGLLKASI